LAAHGHLGLVAGAQFHALVDVYERMISGKVRFRAVLSMAK
jgi:hypothetical protein